MSSDLKGAVKIKGGIASRNEVLVINGRVQCTTIAALAAEGYGESQIKGGVASKGEVEITAAGALKVRAN